MEFFAENRKKLLGILNDGEMLVLFSGKPLHRSADAVYPFTPCRNFYYLSGIEQDSSILVLLKCRGEVKSNLFIKDSDPSMEKWLGHYITPSEAKEISGIDKVLKISIFQDWISRYLFAEEVKSIYLDLERRKWAEDWNDAIRFAREIKNRFPSLVIRNVFKRMSEFRSVKHQCEVEKLNRAIDVTGKGIQRILKKTRPGLMEYQLNAHFSYVLNYQGCVETSFPTICASGKNAVTLHYETNHCELRKGDLVLLDCGARNQHYNADISRTFPVSGVFSDRQKELYSAVLDVEKQVIESVEPGLTLKKLDEICKEKLTEHCVKLRLMESGDDDLKKYCYHGVSHFLGLDAHDPADVNMKLKPGMVITVEPGLYIEEEGIGIRIEDDILVTESGFENLSCSIPKEISEIEEIMSGGKSS